VAAFCDHNIISDAGLVDRGLSDKNSAKYRRHTLPPGRHEDSAHLSVGDSTSTFPTVVATMFRNGPELWARFRQAGYDVNGLYDLWLQVCVLGDKQPVFYVPNRLASYRVHAGHPRKSGQPIPIWR